MKKYEIKDLVNSAIKTNLLCAISYRFDANDRYCFPIMASEKLFLVANEDYFLIDGFSINRFKDVKNAVLLDNKYTEIIKGEGILDRIKTPNISIDDWYSAFDSLSKLNVNIIIEKESLDDEDEFAIGKIVKVLKSKVIFRHFDENGIWQDDLYEVPYSQITSVTFDNRYINTYSKYIKE